jgi:hypothetical protein
MKFARGSRAFLLHSVTILKMSLWIEKTLNNQRAFTARDISIITNLETGLMRVRHMTRLLLLRRRDRARGQPDL